jgi:hypothetical protein
MIRTTIHHLAALAALVTVPLAFAACSVSVNPGSGCDVDGKHHAINDSWAADDGCNTCACNEDGTWGCTEKACPTCEWNGTQYYEGETFSAGDGCNTCSCDAGGNVGCTEIWCTTCLYGGKQYNPGESFPAIDGCNSCSCDDTGNVACTDAACACDPEAEWWRDYVATDPKECQVIDYACPPSTTMFGNACGCGCEQDASCPESFDCAPPATCDEQQIHDQCPYSTIAY